MANAIALCTTFGCSGITLFENVPSCFSPIDMPCETCNSSVNNLPAVPSDAIF